MENNKITCSDLGYSCTMEPKLYTEKRKIYATEEVPAVGPDAREGDTYTRTTDIVIGREKYCEAYYECSHCHKKELVATKIVGENENVTFETLLEEKEKKENFEQKKKDFLKAQKEELEKFIYENDPSLSPCKKM